MEESPATSIPDTPAPDENEELFSWHYYLTTYAFWIGLVAATIHVTYPDPPGVLTDAAFALTFGVLVVGTGVSSDWGNKAHRAYCLSNLLTHVLPFLLVLAAIKSRPSTPSPMWKMVVLACIPPLMFDLTCGERADHMYQIFSPASEKAFMVPLLMSTTLCGALVRSHVV